MTDPIFDLIINDLRAREAQGAETYRKARMEAHDGRDSLVDLYEELLDAVAYAKKEIVERKPYEGFWRRLRLAEAVCYGVGAGSGKRLAESTLDTEWAAVACPAPESDEDYARRMGWELGRHEEWSHKDACGVWKDAAITKRKRWKLWQGGTATKHPTLRAAVDAYAAQEVGS